MMETIVCVGTGTSLTRADLAVCQGRAGVIVINDAWILAPWADALYAADGAWWRRHPEAHAFPAAKYVCGDDVPGVTRLRRAGYLGWSDDPTAVYSAGHSGYQAVQVAAHRGARRILLLGYDCCRSAAGATNVYPTTKPKPFATWRASYRTLAEEAARRGLAIINCSRQTALTVFPRQPITEALAA